MILIFNCSFQSIFKKQNDVSATDNTVVSVFPIGENFYAFTESPRIRHFDSETLETLELVDIKEQTGVITQTSHPVVVEDGSLFNLGLAVTSAGAEYILFGVPNTEDSFKSLKILSKIPPKRKNYPAYSHSFAYTENYFVVIEQPFSISVYATLKGLFFRITALDIFKWLEKEPAYIHLIDRKTGEVVHTFETETFFYFHTINAYEENNHVVLDIICYRNSEIVKGMFVKNMRNLQKNQKKTKMYDSRPLRFVFPLNYSTDDKTDKNLINLNGSDAKAYMQPSGTVLSFPELLCDVPFEFGTIYLKKHQGRKYRYAYGIGNDLYVEFPSPVIKIDTKEKTILTWHEENVYPSEPLFVPSPNATAEDEGVVVCALLKGKEDTNFIGLLILDAKNLKEIGRCEFKDLPSSIPKTFHGWFLDENALKL